MKDLSGDVEITGAGYISGIIIWVVIMWYAANQIECAKLDSCSAGNLFLFSIIGLGILAPAWIVASLVTVMIGK